MAERTRCEICNRTFKDADGLAAHNKAKHLELEPKEEKPLQTKKIRNWGIFIVIMVLLIFGVYGLIKGGTNGRTIVNESNLTFDAPTMPIHWHPHLTIKIDGRNEVIPTNIGITSGAHTPIHTHDTSGILHMESDRPTKKTVTLGYFFEVWGKRLSKDCIFDYCTNRGTLKMYVNGQENSEFENYFMQDGDDMRIEYISNGESLR